MRTLTTREHDEPTENTTSTSHDTGDVGKWNSCHAVEIIRNSQSTNSLIVFRAPKTEKAHDKGDAKDDAHDKCCTGRERMETSGRTMIYRECTGGAVTSDKGQTNTVQTEVI